MATFLPGVQLSHMYLDELTHATNTGLVVG